MPLSAFHPIVAGWFQSRFAGPTEPQAQGWPAIAAGRHTLISAPTGSGKTLTAFLAVIDRLLRESIGGTLADELRVVYVSPLRALSNDMHRNLEVPLAEIMQHAQQLGVSPPPLRVGLRTGDTPSHKRAALVKKPPHILVTTPESLYLMLTAEKSREVLKSVDTLIVDEIHALVRDKRGSHLALSVERMAALTDRPLQRIGLSATQKPIERMAEFLVGVGEPVSSRRVGFNAYGAGTEVPATIDEPRPSLREGRATRFDDALAEPVAPDVEGRPAVGGVARSGDRPQLEPGDRPQLRALASDVPAKAGTPTGPVIVDVGHARDLDLAIEVPPSELSAVCSHEQWAEVHQRLVELIQSHRSTLLFVNTRNMAERLTHQLTQLLGEDAVSCHHGSLAMDLRHGTEQRLKSGQLKAVVATASLELGIDVGHIDLVIQIGSPRSIATFLQRIGRSGHALGLIPKGRLFALTRDELLECMALIRAIEAGRLDAIPIPEAPLDVLAQQIVAECAAREWSTDELFALFRRAYPYRDLERRDFDETIGFLSEGVTSGSGRQFALLHHDQVNRVVRGRRGARLAAISNGGAIPETDNARVVLDPENTVVGSVDEEFAVESNAGDIFLLGNSSWRISRLRGNDLIVTDAHGAPPTVPFWRGEAPGRTLELSEEISQLREELERRVVESDFAEWVRGLEERESVVAGEGRPAVVGVARSGDRPQRESVACDAPSEAVAPGDFVEGSATSGEAELRGSAFPSRSLGTRESFDHPLIRALADEVHCTQFAAFQMLLYVASQRAAIGLVPTQQQVVFERFFDESGGMQLVVHAPFGGRINRAWGLAMRKRFCRSFDFELQASADDDGFILSLGPQHSFPIESLFPMLRTDNVQNLLEQAILAVPMFQVRWRWNVTRALLVARQRNGKKVPPALQRFRSDDLLTSVFPKLTGCQENITGDHELPDHPLVQQTMHDCLHEALDLEGLSDVLRRVESGEITFVPRDSREPSPFAYELLNANPYAFLDGGELQERRARAVATRRSLSIESVSDLGRLDPAAIEQVVNEAQPLVRNADELHDVLLSRIVFPLAANDDATRNMPTEWREFYAELAQNGRAATVLTGPGRTACVAAERWPAVRALFPEAVAEPPLVAPVTVNDDWTPSDVRVAAVRGWLEVSGPTTDAETAELLGITVDRAAAALEALEGEGLVLRGQFRPDRAGQEWCHRRLLARIHRLTMAGLRREIEPVDVSVFLRYLHHHHGLLGEARRTGTNGLYETVAQLQGIDLPAVCWERDILSSRLSGYRGEWLDELCLTGEVGWGRLYPRPRDPQKSRPMASITRIAPVSLFLREDRSWLIGGGAATDEPATLSGAAQDVYSLLQQRGAMFATDLLAALPLLPTQLDEALGELVVRGLITSDGIAGLRSLVRVNSSGETPVETRRRTARVVRRRRAAGFSGRWSAWPIESPSTDNARAERREMTEQWAWLLLRRWGVVFKDLLRRETGAPSWFELLQVYRKLEARGEIRGGRFVRGVAGEQFALSESIRELRRLRDAPAENTITVLSGADPLNLIGIVTSGGRLPVTSGNRIAFVDGVPVAARRSGQLLWLAECPAELHAPLLPMLGVATAVAEPSPPRSKEQRPRGPASLWRRFPR